MLRFRFCGGGSGVGFGEWLLALSCCGVFSTAVSSLFSKISDGWLGVNGLGAFAGHGGGSDISFNIAERIGLNSWTGDYSRG